MIKIFRKIRLKLLSESRLGRYFVYAIGEIILVIIGILIALNINNRSELRKTEAKVEAIFEDVMEELVTNVAEIDRFIESYSWREPILLKVLSDRMTYEDYANYQNTRLASVTNHFITVRLSQYSYDNLFQDLDAVPLRLKSLAKDLNHLYTNSKRVVENNNERMIRMVESFNQVRQENYDWYHVQNVLLNEDKIDFMLNDVRYKNEVRRYRTNAISKQLRYAIAFRLEAIECYAKIAKLLDKPEVHDSFYPDSKITDALVGEYIIETNQEIAKYFLVPEQIEMLSKGTFKVFKEGHKLLYEFTEEDITRELTYINDKNYVSVNTVFYTVDQTDSEIILSMDFGWVLKKPLKQ